MDWIAVKGISLLKIYNEDLKFYIITENNF